MSNRATKYVVVSGGVISGVGKGIITASIGKILKEYGYNVTLIKIDPYINFDAGTLRPTEHGEVWVTEDGGEIDQDLGTYERFINEDLSKKNSITTGQVYHAVIERERKGEYLGQTVQYIPHITGEIISRIKKAASGYDIAVIEIGGTVGDYENVPFLFSLKSIERELGSQSVVYSLVTYLPVPNHISEMKTKPTQLAIRMLGEQGIVPDFIICRGSDAIDDVRRKKVEACAHVHSDFILSAPDTDSIYRVPMILEKENFGAKLLTKLGLEEKRIPDWSSWNKKVATIVNPEKKVTIGVVGKYMSTGNYDLTDTYLSVEHALTHAGVQHDVGIEIKWIDAIQLEKDSLQVQKLLSECDGIVVPGGFGSQAVEGKISAINWVREHKIPFLGICYGLQLAVVEFARNMCGLDGAHTIEVDAHTKHPVITLLESQNDVMKEKNYGGTMRLGAYSAQLKPGTRIDMLYKNDISRIVVTTDQTKTTVLERHRHRYEVNPLYVTQLEQAGMVISGTHVRQDGAQLVEYIELPDHPYFVACQAHPEFTSRFETPNPLFYGLVQAALQRQTSRHDALQRKQRGEKISEYAV